MGGFWIGGKINNLGGILLIFEGVIINYMFSWLVSSGVAVGRGVRNVAILKNIGFCYWSTGPCLQS